MIVGATTGSTLGLLTWQWRKIVIFALSATAIEHDTRARLGDTDIPAVPTPDARGILM